MKTFAQLKRDLKVGTIVKTVLNNCKPEMTGEIRKIQVVQSNAIAFERKEDSSRPSWLWWPKASEIEYDGDTFKVYAAPASWNNNTRTLEFIYQIIQDEPKPVHHEQDHFFSQSSNGVWYKQLSLFGD